MRRAADTERAGDGDRQQPLIHVRQRPTGRPAQEEATLGNPSRAVVTDSVVVSPIGHAHGDCVYWRANVDMYVQQLDRTGCLCLRQRFA